MASFQPDQILILVGVAISAFVLGRATRGGEIARNPPVTFDQAPPKAQNEIDSLIMAGKRIDAIRKFRDATGVGLKESKDVVEARARNIGAA